MASREKVNLVTEASPAATTIPTGPLAAIKVPTTPTEVVIAVDEALLPYIREH